MRVTWTITLVVLVVASSALAACATEGPPAASPARSQPFAAGSTPPEPTPGQSSTATPAPGTTPTQQPTTDPPPQPLVLDGTWVKPKAGGRLTSYVTTLSARPAATGDGVTTFTKVVFSASWKGAAKVVACKATRPGKSGAWSCKADFLALGIPPGKVTLSFDVAGVGVPVARSPDGLRRVTYAVRPPRPTNTRLQQIEQPDFEHGTNHGPLLHRVRWSAPAGYADEFIVYETEECPRPSTKENSGKPCFIAGTPVDTTKLVLLATAAGDARSVKIGLTEYECGPSHGTILLRARNEYGSSVFAIVEAAPVIWAPPGDIIC